MGHSGRRKVEIKASGSERPCVVGSFFEGGGSVLRVSSSTGRLLDGVRVCAHRRRPRTCLARCRRRRGLFASATPARPQSETSKAAEPPSLAVSPVAARHPFALHATPERPTPQEADECARCRTQQRRAACRGIRE
ncbi:hypothetical protein MTO96_001022 [Rhipicephalus appendiculatus]